jgi:uncharacterized membrane protein (UPF0127 family)
VVLVAVVAALGFTACGSNERLGARGVTQTIPARGGVAPAGFTAVKVRIVNPDGNVIERCVLLADRDGLRGQGLMGVSDPSLDGIAGMLFVFDDDTTTGFWMKDTLIPLSIAFADQQGTVTFTADMDPCPAGTDPCPLTRPPEAYRLAIEVPQGRLSSLGLGVGARIEHQAGASCTAAKD